VKQFSIAVLLPLAFRAMTGALKKELPWRANRPLGLTVLFRVRDHQPRIGPAIDLPLPPGIVTAPADPHTDRRSCSR
jgi:hypothetical protein